MNTQTRVYQSNFLPSVGYAVLIVELSQHDDGSVKGACHQLLTHPSCELTSQKITAESETGVPLGLDAIFDLVIEGKRNALQVERADPLTQKPQPAQMVIVDLILTDVSALSHMTGTTPCRELLKELAGRVKDEAIALRLKLLSSIRVDME